MSLFETLQHRRARVLFVSQTNFCRDQMAEAFARALGEDCLLAFSAGFYPFEGISTATRAVMAERAVPLFPDQRPKPVSGFDLSAFDLIVNLSGTRMPVSAVKALRSVPVLEPLVPSPLPGDLESHRAVRDRIESFVRFLADHFRRAKEWTPDAPSPTSASQTIPTPPPVAIQPPDASMQRAF